MVETWFDSIKTWDNDARMTKVIVWFKGDTEVKRMEIQPSMKGPYCPACLMWRANPVPMTDYKRFNGVWDDNDNPGKPLYSTFTNLQCPECKGISPAGVTNCTCGEEPHRVHCPMGNRLYFQDEVYDFRERNL